MGHFGHLCTVDFPFQAHTSDLPSCLSAFRLRTCYSHHSLLYDSGPGPDPNPLCLGTCFLFTNLLTVMLTLSHLFSSTLDSSNEHSFLWNGCLVLRFLKSGSPTGGIYLFLPLVWCQGLVEELASPIQASSVGSHRAWLHLVPRRK